MFWFLQSRSEFLGVSEDSQVPFSRVWVATSHSLKMGLRHQRLIAATINIPPTIDAPTFVDPMGEFFRVLELEFPIKSSEKIL